MRGFWRVVSAAIVLGATAAGAGAAEKYQVVVHWTNPIAGLKAAVIAAIFLKKAVRWPDGREVLPVDQSLRSPVREAFTREVIGDSTLAIESYWQRQIASGRTPPLTKANDLEVQAYVEQHATAIGYISGDAKLKGSVKVIKVVK